MRFLRLRCLQGSGGHTKWITWLLEFQPHWWGQRLAAPADRMWHSVAQSPKFSKLAGNTRFFWCEFSAFKNIGSYFKFRKHNMVGIVQKAWPWLCSTEGPRCNPWVFYLTYLISQKCTKGAPIDGLFPVDIVLEFF